MRIGRSFGFLTAAGWVLAITVAGVAVADEDKEKLQGELEELRTEVESLRKWRADLEASGVLGAAETLGEAGEAGESEGDAPSSAAADDDSASREPRIRLPNSMSLSVSGELRTRFEYRDPNYSALDPSGTRSLDFTHMRSRLRFDLEVEEDIRAVFEIQDVRTWGDEGATTADSEGLDLKRGYIELDNVVEDGVKLELGRQVWIYGDERLIGALEWVDQGRTYDGFRLGYHPDEEDYWVDFFGARVRDDAFDIVPAQDFLAVYAGLGEVEPGVNVEGYVIYLRDQMRAFGELDSGNTQFYTIGARVFGGQDLFDYTTEFAYQTGDVNSDDLSAYAMALEGGLTIEEAPLTPRLDIGFDYATGDEDNTDGDTETFQVLFPTNHKHFGYADLAAWSNILDLHGGVSAKPHDDVRFSIDFHYLRLADEMGGWFSASGAQVRPGQQGASKDLGNELDFAVEWQTTESLALLAGYSRFLAGDFISDTGGGGDSDFFYLQAHLRF